MTLVFLPNCLPSFHPPVPGLLWMMQCVQIKSLRDVEVTTPLLSCLHAGRPAPGCSYQAKYRGAFVCRSRARIFSLEFSFLLSSHPPSDNSWHFSCRQSKATAFFFFFPFATAAPSVICGWWGKGMLSQQQTQPSKSGTWGGVSGWK